MIQLDKDNMNNKVHHWGKKFYIILVQASYILLQDLKTGKDPSHPEITKPMR